MLNIVIDTREQQPLDFGFYPDVTTISRKLKTGDYCLEGMEDFLVIERKHSVGEITNNIGIEKQRFLNELDRMSSIKYAYLVCEFSIANVLEFPKNSGIPENKWKKLKMNGKFILKTLYGFEQKYGITVCFCDNRAGSTKKIIEICEYVQKIMV